MITGGNATVFISSMDSAVRFYTDVLGLKLAERYDDAWATIDAGKGLTIGLHPSSPQYAAPGTKGAVMIGLQIDEPIATVVDRLKERGVVFTGSIVETDAGKFAHFEDPDGNELYLWGS
jgi:predicted enzyme related to lactoylglutathione lyase